VKDDALDRSGTSGFSLSFQTMGSMGGVSFEGELGKDRTRESRRVAEWFDVDIGMEVEVLVSGCFKSDLGHC